MIRFQMNNLKSKINNTTLIKLIFSFLLVLCFSACSLNKANLTNPSYTMKVSASQIQENMQKSFPIKQNVVVGSISLINPQIVLNKKTNKMQTGLTFSYKPPFFSAQSGTIDLSGGIHYNKQNKSFYMLNPSIDNMKHNNSAMAFGMPDNMKSMMSSLVNEVFKKYPVYELKSNSISEKIIQKTLKSVKIDDGNMLLKFGI